MVRVLGRAGLAGAATALVVLGGVSSAYGSIAVAATTPTPSASSKASTKAPTKARPTSPDAAPKSAAAKAALAAAGESHLSAAALAAQIARAQVLSAELSRSGAAIAAAATRLDRLAAQANTLLQAYATARAAEAKAKAEADRSVRIFQELSSQAGRDRQVVVQWANQAYEGGGGSLSDMSALFSLLALPPEAASDTAAQLSYLTDKRNAAFERVRDQAQLQRDVAAQAVEASTRAAEESAKAAAAKRALDTVVAQQKSQLAATRALHAARLAQAGPVSGLLLGSGTAAALEAARQLRKSAVVPGMSLNGSVKACSHDEKPYPNGQVPASALCPLYGNPAQSLRPGAAAAFNALSLAFERDTGHPICVTDSYRSFAEQVLVKADRGKWAAAPGTSQHGKGLAVDLCGGIEDFGTPAHLWMRQNAPLYGWFHPDWAEPTGALPEPWHWEYAG